MQFNSRTTKQIELDGVTFSVRQLTASQQAHLTDDLAKANNHADLVKCAHVALDYALADITGLKDEEGKYIKPERKQDGSLPFEFVDGFGIADLRRITASILKAGQVSEIVKKN